MMNLIDISKKLSNSQLTEIININNLNKESDIFLKINKQKLEDYEKKRKNSKEYLKKIVIIFNSTNYGEVSSESEQYLITKINTTEFISKSTSDQIKIIENSIVLFTNNIFAEIGIEKLFQLKNIASNTLWVVQDYDNHHWIENSIQAAIFSDIYVPSHMDGEIGLLGKINSNITEFIPCGSNQWSTNFINNNINNLKLKGRNESPFGTYYFYDKFKTRNKYISILNSFFCDIKITEIDFHKLTQKEKWAIWTERSIHWIIPTANDLPIRFFDALLTGGLPIVPVTLRQYLKILGINNKYYLTYNQNDIYNPHKLINEARIKISQGGDVALRERSNFALNNFHVNAIIKKIYNAVKTINNN